MDSDIIVFNIFVWEIFSCRNIVPNKGYNDLFFKNCNTPLSQT